jgi:hypothetical protein
VDNKKYVSLANLQTFLGNLKNLFATKTDVNEIKEAKADWGQNDATAVDYIKNRTHYEDETGKIVQLDEKFIPDTIARASDLDDISDTLDVIESDIDDLEADMKNMPSAGTKLTGILSAGETTITFTSDEITSDTKLNAVYTSIFGVQLESASFGDGTLTLEFPAQENDMNVVALINATMTNEEPTGGLEAGDVLVKLNEEIARAKAREDEIAGLATTAQKEVDALENVVGEITPIDPSVINGLFA